VNGPPINRPWHESTFDGSTRDESFLLLYLYPRQLKQIEIQKKMKDFIQNLTIFKLNYDFLVHLVLFYVAVSGKIEKSIKKSFNGLKNKSLHSD
jgi:hypothetical protein